MITYEYWCCRAAEVARDLEYCRSSRHLQRKLDEAALIQYLNWVRGWQKKTMKKAEAIAAANEEAAAEKTETVLLESTPCLEATSSTTAST